MLAFRQSRFTNGQVYTSYEITQWHSGGPLLVHPFTLFGCCCCCTICWTHTARGVSSWTTCLDQVCVALRVVLGWFELDMDELGWLMLGLAHINVDTLAHAHKHFLVPSLCLLALVLRTIIYVEGCPPSRRVGYYCPHSPTPSVLLSKMTPPQTKASVNTCRTLPWYW